MMKRVFLAVVLCLFSSWMAGCGKQAPPPAGGAPARPAPAVAPTAAAPVAAPSVFTVNELLNKASTAVNTQRLLAPPGDNAVEYYLKVLAQEPNNPQATQALVDIFPLAVGVAERVINQRQLDEGARMVGLLDRASPGSYTVNTLKGKLEAIKQQQVRELAQAAQQATAQQQAQAAAAPRPQSPNAPQPLAAAVNRDPRPAAPGAASDPAQDARNGASQSAGAADTESSRRAGPETAAEPATSVPPASVRSTEKAARLIRQVPPAFPVAAARRRQKGWVELEFTIGADGRVSDVQVVRSEPNKLFDRAAMRAVSQWVYEPATRDGEPVASRGRRRVEFLP